MGTLSPPFILCPLSDRKELMGMSEDRTQNKVIITIGRNIAIRYHILEQKQECSWTISRHWLTSRVVFCSDFDKYGAIIDHNMVGLWDEEDTAVNRFKVKIKLSQPLFELRPTRTLGTLVIFENGFVSSVNRLLASKQKNKEFKGFINMENEVIIDVALNERDNQIVLIVGTKMGENQLPRQIQKRRSLKLVVIKLASGLKDDEDESGSIESSSKVLFCNIISQHKKDIVGHCIVPGEQLKVVYICSDGKMYQQRLEHNKEKNTSSVVGYIGSDVSVKTPLVMRYNEEGSAFVIYGSDPSEEGAVVFLYDLKYDILVAKQSLKLYGTPPIMEKIGRNIIVPVGLHILVLGFQVSNSLLSSVVGKHKIQSGEEVFEQRTPWTIGPSQWEVDKDPVPMPENARKKLQERKEKQLEKEMQLIKTTFPDYWEIVQQYKILEREGQPESLICNQIIPLALESENLAALDWILDIITDIPESMLIMILSYLLRQLEDPSIHKNKVKDEPKLVCQMYSPDPRVNRLLLRNFDERELIRHLPLFDYELVRQFVFYLKSMMEHYWPLKDEDYFSRQNDEMDSVSEISASCWMKWISALLDAHYPKFVLNNEISLVEEMLTILQERVKVLDAIEELEPYLLMTYNKVNFEPRPNPNSKWRTEIITFV